MNRTWQAYRDMLSTLTVALAFAFLLWTCGSAVYNHFEEPAFEPLESRPVIVEGPVAPGGMIRMRDGVCNNTSTPIVIDITVTMQRAATVATHPVTLAETNDYTLYNHSCIGTQPATLRVPEDALIGTYTLTVRASTVSPSGKQQIATRTSESFEVQARVESGRN